MVLSSLLFPTNCYCQGVVAVSSPSTSRKIPINGSEDTGCHEGITSSDSVLPTPQTVSYERKKRSRTDYLPHLHTPASNSEVQSGPAIPSHLSRPPLTPSRTKPQLNLSSRAHRTTPHSQRIVPSSQWSVDEQVLDSSMETNGPNSDPFILLHQQEPDSGAHELILPQLGTADLPSRSPTISSLTPVKSDACALPSSIGSGSGTCPWRGLPSTGNISGTKTRPPSLSSSLHPVSLYLSGYGPRHQSQSSQVVPTSQFDEIELKVPSRNVTVSSMRLTQLVHSEAASCIKRCGHPFVVSFDVPLLMIYIIKA
jgi:hypothetical protein